MESLYKEDITCGFKVVSYEVEILGSAGVPNVGVAVGVAGYEEIRKGPY